MVVGGYPDYFKSELIDLSGQKLSCPLIRNYPVQYGSVGTFINNKTLVCGGNYYTTECFSYDMKVNKINMYSALIKMLKDLIVQKIQWYILYE